jgi:hypothetical protein
MVKLIVAVAGMRISAAALRFLEHTEKPMKQKENCGMEKNATFADATNKATTTFYHNNETTNHFSFCFMCHAFQHGTSPNGALHFV